MTKTKLLYAISGAVVFNIGINLKTFEDIKFGYEGFCLPDINENQAASIDTMQTFFKQYEIDAQTYLDKPTFTGTPLSGTMLAECARNAYDSTGIIVPLNLALAQAQFESGMGRKGRSPITNPYNIGEWDGKTVTRFTTTKQGVQSYYFLMASRYLVDKSPEELYQSFTNTAGHRYAKAKDYERKISNQATYIERWIDENMSIEAEG